MSFWSLLETLNQWFYKSISQNEQSDQEIRLHLLCLKKHGLVSLRSAQLNSHVVWIYMFSSSADMIESLLWGPSFVAVVAGMVGRPQQWVGIKDGLKRWQLSGELSTAGK